MTRLRKNNSNMPKYLLYLTLFALSIGVCFGVSKSIASTYLTSYTALESVQIYDAQGERLSIAPNSKGHYAVYREFEQFELQTALLQKEDTYFRYHPGINPVSMMRGAVRSLRSKPSGSSTITQQLLKIVYGNEQDRTVRNKLKETIGALSIELHLSKEDILTHYMNSVYFGNQMQGLTLASEYYFDALPQELSTEEIQQLVYTIQSPSVSNPFANTSTKPLPIEPIIRATGSIELLDMGITCEHICSTSLDGALTETIRSIARRHVEELETYNVDNAAVVVIDAQSHTVLSVVGVVEPHSVVHGAQINMAHIHRPIGSTVKPFIYAKGFEQGLRPYTMVDDREYRYAIADGFGFYPKNYDYEYRGPVSLHYALSNSLNVPTVKVYEYVTQAEMNRFFLRSLEYTPLQSIEDYGLSVALGGFEMTPLQLASYMTIFANEGMLHPVHFGDVSYDTTITNTITEPKQVLEKKYVQLTNAILSDRVAGVEQFGLENNLNLPQDNYAVKTGTSQDYRDSWTIGYTPDYVVAVWMGNADTAPTKEISGSIGAGRLWADIMNVMRHSEYHNATPLQTEILEMYTVNDTLVYGLPGDDTMYHRDLITPNTHIFAPHDGDVISLDDDTQIMLQSNSSQEWYIDDIYIGEGTRVIADIDTIGTKTVTAISGDGLSESVTIYVQ